MPPWVPIPDQSPHPDYPESSWLRYDDLEIIILKDGSFLNPAGVMTFKKAVEDRYRPPVPTVEAFVPATLFTAGATGQAVWSTPEPFGDQLELVAVTITPREVQPSPPPPPAPSEPEDIEEEPEEGTGEEIQEA